MGRCDADQPSGPSSPYSDASLLSVPQPGAAAAPPGRRSTLPGLCADHLACSSKRAVQLAPAAAVPFRGRRAELTPTGHRTRRAELFWVRGFSGCSWLCAGLGGTGREKKRPFLLCSVSVVTAASSLLCLLSFCLVLIPSPSVLSLSV